MSITLEFELPNLDDVTPKAEAAIKKGLRLAADTQRDAIKTRVMRKTGVDGQALTPSHRSAEEGGQPLMDNGTMIASLQVIRSNATEAVIGFAQVMEGMKATVHNEGRVIKFKRPGWHSIPIIRRTRVVGWFRAKDQVVIPKREFFGVSEAEAARIEKIMDDTMEEAVK